MRKKNPGYRLKGPQEPLNLVPDATGMEAWFIKAATKAASRWPTLKAKIRRTLVIKK
jgi:hypothetical protein